MTKIAASAIFDNTVTHRKKPKHLKTMKKKTVIVDIDGTMSKVGDRIKYLQKTPKDWSSFYKACGEDEPIKPIVKLVNQLSKKYCIAFCTGRTEITRDITVDWLRKHLNERTFKNAVLLMRDNGDHRHDTLVKPELIEQAGIELDDIAFVLEDRNSVVAKWREMGLTCLQVADGDF